MLGAKHISKSDFGAILKEKNKGGEKLSLLCFTRLDEVRDRRVRLRHACLYLIDTPTVTTIRMRATELTVDLLPSVVDKG